MSVFNLFEEGIAFAKARKYIEALICLDKAIELNPSCFYAWQTRGFILWGLDGSLEVLDCFSKCAELFPFSSSAWQNKGEVLWCCFGRIEEAIECFDMALELDPENETARMMQEDARKELSPKRRR